MYSLYDLILVVYFYPYLNLINCDEYMNMSSLNSFSNLFFKNTTTKNNLLERTVACQFTTVPFKPLSGQG